MLAWALEVDGRNDVHVVEREANTHNLREAVYLTNGVPEVTASWVASNLGRFRFVDVREPMELRGPMGRALQSENVPLSRLMVEADTWDRHAPVVVMCQSGGRSARAAMALQRAGFTDVASMEGGIMGWRAVGAGARG